MPSKTVPVSVIVLILAVVLALVGLNQIINIGYLNRPQAVEVQSGSCTNGTVSIVLKNTGMQSIPRIQVNQTVPVGDTAEDWNTPVPAGSTIVYNDVCVGKGPRYCAYAFEPPGGDVTRTTVYCKEDATISDMNVCQNAQGGGLCQGLDVLYGNGYKAACCSEWNVCCV